MIVYSTILKKWFKTPGECLIEEERNRPGSKQNEKNLEKLKEEAVSNIIASYNLTKMANIAMFSAAKSLIELFDAGGDMVKATEINVADQETMLMVLHGIFRKADTIRIIDSGVPDFVFTDLPDEKNAVFEKEQVEDPECDSKQDGLQDHDPDYKDRENPDENHAFKEEHEDAGNVVNLFNDKKFPNPDHDGEDDSPHKV